MMATLLSWVWHIVALATALVVVAHGDSLPRLLVWPAWGLLSLVSFVIHVLAGASVWVDSALPYRGLSPVPGGPGMRPVAYHRPLQQRVGEGSRLDWINWWAGLLLRGGSFLGVLVATAFVLGLQLPSTWGFAGFALVYHLSIILAGLLASPGITLLMRILRGFWQRSEPPDLPETPAAEPDGIGVARAEIGWNQRVLALAWRLTPLPTLLLLLTAAPLLAFPEQGARLACLGVAVAAVLGYPVWTWSQYLARRALGQ
ncbi:hypothetical protein JST97_06555 [bacterium]|nr:hypothetical protein [bacterium]